MALGDRGADVRKEQERLNGLGANLVVDGIWGPKTQAAVEKYATKEDSSGSSGSSTPSTAKGKPDYTPDNNQGRFNLVGGNPDIWYNKDTKGYLVVYYVPNSEPPLPIYWEVPDTDTLEAYFGPDVEVKADLNITNAQLVEWGALGQGSSLEIPETDQDPLLSWAEIYERQAEVRPYLKDPEVIGLIMGAAIEGRSVTQAELESTEWWQTRTEAQREWAIKVEADPMSAQQTIDSNKARVVDDLAKAGMKDAPEELVAFLATKYTTGAWTENILISQVAAVTDPWSEHVMNDETKAFMSGVGEVDTSRKEEDTVRQLLRRWLGPTFGQWSDKDVAAKAGSLRNDPDGEIEFVESLKDQRMAMFPNYKDRSVSYESIMQPWKSYTENKWGQPIDELDQSFQTAMGYNDPEKARKLLTQTGFDRGYSKVVGEVSDGIEKGMSSSVRGAV